jgi:hypothetical protein
VISPPSTSRRSVSSRCSIRASGRRWRCGSARVFAPT